MTNCNSKTIRFSPLKCKKIGANFAGADITSNTGALLLREIDKKLGLSEALAKAIPDNRHQSYCDHSVLSMLKQRIYALAMGVKM